jgi:putative peptide zinc metalloprotease protein
VISLTKDSLVELHELASRRENKEEILIGRPDIGKFIVLPNLGADIIRWLGEGETIRQIEQRLPMDGAYSESVEVHEFVQTLMIDYAFIFRVDGIIVNEKNINRGHFSWVPVQAAQHLFGRPAIFLYGLIGVIAALIVTGHPSYLPGYQDVFLSKSLSVSLLFTTAITWALLFLHEFAHLLAARTLGVICRIGTGHRMIFPVAETDMTGIVLIPHARRYRAYMAGMLWDIVFFSLTIELQWLLERHAISLSTGTVDVIRMVSFNLLNLLIFQFMFFMKTDIYYVVTTFIRCENLLEHTLLYLKSKFRKLSSHEQEEWEAVSGREKQLIRWYSGFYLLGSVLIAAWFASVLAPLMAIFISRWFEAVTEGPLISWHSLDCLSLLSVLLLPLGIWIRSWIRTSFSGKEVKRNENQDKSRETD